MFRQMCAVVVLAAASLAAAQTSPGQAPRPGQPSAPQQPARDTPAQQQETPAPAGRIIGRVLAADSGRPVKRARVSISAPELPEGRAALTDDTGLFEFTELPAGRYSLNASKNGFIGLSYGQRRPLQSGTPLQLADGQQLKGLEFRLPRGGVVGGHVFDETGDALPGVIVSVLRYQYLQGDRRLVPAGTAQTDDRGQYRVWGLNPGDYYVSAVNRDFGGRGFGGGGRGFGGRGAGGGAGIVSAGVAPDDQEQLAYAPTYYPGVGSAAEARPITLGVSQQVTDVDFNLQLVRTSRIAGRVVNPDGSPTTSGTVSLASEAAGTGGRGAIGANYGSRIDWDGSFGISNVPPGRYTLRARGTDSEQPQFASQPLSVNGDMPDLSIVLRPGGALAGRVTFEATQSSAPGDLTQIRIAAPATDPNAQVPNPNARVEKDGRFTLDGLAAGPHLVRPNGGGALRGWTLKAVTLNGRDVTDTPLDVRSGETIANLTIVFTDKQTEIDGTITDEQSVPITDYTVLAFSTDSSTWRPQSRHIMTTRPDQNGRYRLRGLPPGEYYMATIDPSEPGEWFDATYLDEHRAGAARLTVGEGDVKTQDFRVKR